MGVVYRMVTPLFRDCPGCGVRLPVTEAQPDTRFNASAECWHLYGELSAYTLQQGDVEFIHQLAVDAYAAQHAGEHVRPIAVAFGLIGLYLTCERDYSGRQVQHMHQLLANRSKNWPRFALPPQRGSVTVRDVMRKQSGTDRDDMLWHWALSVWDAWSAEHEQVKALMERVMAD